MTKTRETIARVEFRWRQHEDEFAERLTESAQEAGRSMCDHARELMKNALTSDEQLQHRLHRIEQELTQLHRQLRELRKITTAFDSLHERVYELRDDLATYAVKLLTDAGSLAPEAAERWVKEVTRAD